MRPTPILLTAMLLAPLTALNAKDEATNAPSTVDVRAMRVDDWQCKSSFEIIAPRASDPLKVFSGIGIAFATHWAFGRDCV